MMSNICAKMVLSEEKKRQIVQNGYKIADQRRKKMKTRRNIVVIMLITVGIIGVAPYQNSDTASGYPLQVYAQEISESNEIDLAEDKTFSLEKVETPLGPGYKLYTSVDQGYYCETVSDPTDEGLEVVFSGNDYIYWVPDYWENNKGKVYDEHGNALEYDSEASNHKTTVTYCVYDENDALKFQMTLSLQEKDDAGQGEIIKLTSYPEVKEE